MEKRFLVSTANVVGMIGDNVIFEAKTNSVTGVTLSTSNTDIRGGQGNALQARFFHSPEMGIELQETQFRMEFIALNAGSTIINGGRLWTSESVTLNGTTGTLLEGTPIPVNNDTYVYFEYNNVNYKAAVVGSTFSVSGLGIPNDVTLCVSYMSQNLGARTIVIPANIVPSRIRLIMTANLYGDTNGDGYVGKVQIEIPNAQLSGALELSMNADGHSTTPLNATALAYSDTNAVGCSNNNYYAKFVEYINNANWYDSVIGIGIAGGDFEMTEGDTATLNVYAFYADGTSALVDNSELTFASSDQTVATIGTNTGLVSALVAGSTLINVYITNKSTIEANLTLTVNAA